ncbi:sulfite exporter TauE/SafE family protein [Conexibacter sp. CPCC 206217]|uniref:sulfite exporter TauE/SafE family protein n=1 Tax=Conexibacter sp. CPCC 206217 TaxID=3064574 RepID=UPI0027227B7B|nr:sulfite exporter TauE/SafE family protein [Conexibacter sp. CPCC 206217]MDO8210515.1 sulfite exporter TauE/SafE family protein [Conexibacter sp. CPCC 206217]
MSGPASDVTQPSPRGRTLRLAAIGTAGGLFSGLFGVGGGTVMVPLLLLWMGYEARSAAATSLGAIVLIAGFAAATQGLYGNVDVLSGVLVGVPAIGGVLIGTWLQQKLPSDTIAFAFAGLLVVAAVNLVLR